jgi:hypothetical protein
MKISNKAANTEFAQYEDVKRKERQDHKKFRQLHRSRKGQWQTVD